MGDGVKSGVVYADYVVDGYDYKLLKIGDFLDLTDMGANSWCWRTENTANTDFKTTGVNVATTGVACVEVSSAVTLNAADIADFLKNGGTFYLSAGKSYTCKTGYTWSGMGCKK